MDIVGMEFNKILQERETESKLDRKHEEWKTGTSLVLLRFFFYVYIS